MPTNDWGMPTDQPSTGQPQIDPRVAEMRDKMLAYRGQKDQAAGQFQGGLSLPEQLPPGAIDPRMQMMLMNRNQQPQTDPTAGDQDMRNRMMMNRNAMQRPAQGMMQPQNFGRQPMAPPIQEQAATQANGVAGQGGTPAQMPMANQMNRRQMMGRRMGQRMGMQRPQGQSEVGNPNAPTAGRSITPF